MLRLVAPEILPKLKNERLNQLGYRILAHLYQSHDFFALVFWWGSEHFPGRPVTAANDREGFVWKSKVEKYFFDRTTNEPWSIGLNVNFWLHPRIWCHFEENENLIFGKNPTLVEPDP